MRQKEREEERRKARPKVRNIRELRAALRQLGVNLDNGAARMILAKYDADQSGSIDLHEFQALVRDLPSLIGPRGAYEDPFARDFLTDNTIAA